jgi:hypothetical protein
VPLDEARVDLVASKAVQRTVVGRVDAPERRAAGIGEPRGVLVAQQPEQAEDHVRVYVDSGVRRRFVRSAGA